jgi:hypothetical protein
LRSSVPFTDPNRVGSGVGFCDQNNRLAEQRTTLSSLNNCPSRFLADRFGAIIWGHMIDSPIELSTHVPTETKRAIRRRKRSMSVPKFLRDALRKYLTGYSMNSRPAVCVRQPCKLSDGAWKYRDVGRKLEVPQ